MRNHAGRARRGLRRGGGDGGLRCRLLQPPNRPGLVGGGTRSDRHRSTGPGGPCRSVGVGARPGCGVVRRAAIVLWCRSPGRDASHDVVGGGARRSPGDGAGPPGCGARRRTRDGRTRRSRRARHRSGCRRAGGTVRVVLVARPGRRRGHGAGGGSRRSRGSHGGHVAPRPDGWRSGGRSRARGGARARGAARRRPPGGGRCGPRGREPDGSGVARGGCAAPRTGAGRSRRSGLERAGGRRGLRSRRLGVPAAGARLALRSISCSIRPRGRKAP